MNNLSKLTSLTIVFLLTSNILAQEITNKLKFYGDVRFRTEMDRDSERTDGSKRVDRDRFRYRLRFGLKYALNKSIELGGRIRSGNPLNQQSPHTTLGKEFHSDDFSIDKAYIKLSDMKGNWAWVGKNSMPFWKQNELLWDDDVNPEGIALGGSFKLSEESKLTPVFGYFIVGHSGKKLSSDNQLSIAQLKYDTKPGENNLIVSSGMISGKDLPNTPDGTHTFLIDYSIWASSFQFNLNNTGLKFGLDYFTNLNDYKNNANIPDVFEDQTDAFVGSVFYNTNYWQFGYFYANVEKFATVDYFAQDDWVRWGNNNYSRSTNFNGHEFRIKYDIAKDFNTVLRVYFVEGIKTSGSNLETGTRVRLDFNIKF
jgi:hypothetical protein